MKFLKQAAFIIIFACGGLVNPAASLNAQDDYEPPVPIYITTHDGIALSVTFVAFDAEGYLDIESENFSISINLGQSDNASFTINNTDSSNNWGPGVIEITNGWGSPPEDEVVDVSILPDQHRGLWERLRITCGELLEIQEFWDLFLDFDEDQINSLKSDMELMRDGYFSPDYTDWLVMTQYIVKGWGDGRVARGYRLEGPIELNVFTPSPWGDENPEIEIRMLSMSPQGDWRIHIDPVTEVCGITWSGCYGEDRDPTEEDWPDMIDQIRSGLEFYNRRVPALIEGGVIDENDELGLLIEKSLYGLSTFPFEAVDPDRNDELSQEDVDEIQ